MQGLATTTVMNIFTIDKKNTQQATTQDSIPLAGGAAHIDAAGDMPTKTQPQADEKQIKKKFCLAFSAQAALERSSSSFSAKISSLLAAASRADAAAFSTNSLPAAFAAAAAA